MKKLNNIKQYNELTSMKSSDLKKVCKELGVVGYSKMTVTSLLDTINNSYTEQLVNASNGELRKFLTAKGAVGIAKTNKKDLSEMIMGKKPIKGLTEEPAKPAKKSTAKPAKKSTAKPAKKSDAKPVGRTENFEEMTVSELRQLCKERKLSRYSKANKPTLIGMLTNNKPTEKSATELVLDSFEDAIDISTDVEEEDTPDTPEDDNSITVVNGARTRSVDLQEGDTIWVVHERMRDEMSITSNPSFSVNNTTVGNNYKFQPGDKIEFFAPNGNKG